MKSFASDNWSPVHQQVLDAIAKVNGGHQASYHQDELTARVNDKFCELFGADVICYFASCGTAANVLGLSSMVKYNQGVICAETAHINTDEAGAFERFSGCKLLTVPHHNGKIDLDELAVYTDEIGNFHRVQPAVISVSETTEVETVYTLDELRAIGEYAHGKGMLFHVDGARCANACAALGCSIKELLTDNKVDVVSFGGTKNGMMYGDAVVFLNRRLAKGFGGLLKQGMQSLSKTRYIAAQFEAIMTGDLWLKNARKANEMAKHLEKSLVGIKQVQITRKVESNAVYAILPKESADKLIKEFPFYVWDPRSGEVRLMCSFDTQKSDIDAFVTALKLSL